MVRPMKQLNSNPFLDLEFEELFNIPLGSEAEDAKKDSPATTTDPDAVKVPAPKKLSAEDVQSIADINALPSPAAGGVETPSEQSVLSNFIQIAISTHVPRYGLVESIARDLSVFNTGQEYVPDDYQDLLLSPSSTQTIPVIPGTELENPEDPEDPEQCLGDVTTTADIIDSADGLISLREAVIAANQVNGTTHIHLCNGEYDLSITGKSEEFAMKGDLDIRSQIVIEGQNRENTIINANQIDRLFQIMPTASLSLKNVTLIGGEVGQFSGGALFNQGTLVLDNVILSGNKAKNGGAIYNENGSIIINDSIMNANHAALNGGGILNSGANAIIELSNSELKGNSTSGYGGGISNQSGSVQINHSTLHHNQASYMGGGVINLYGKMLVDASTLSGNTATLVGGGLANLYGESFQVLHSTVTDNMTLLSGGGLYSNQPDPAKWTSFFSSIIADNYNDFDLSGIGFRSLGYNLIGNTDGVLLAPNAGDQFGSLNGISATGHLGVINPLLDVLADNGGKTLTHALLVSSPAINAGDMNDFSSDQRAENVIGIKDIGAYEIDSSIQLRLISFSQPLEIFNPITEEEIINFTSVFESADILQKDSVLSDLSSNFSVDALTLQLNEILSDFSDPDHFDMQSLLDRLEIFSAPLIMDLGSLVLESADMAISTAYSWVDELHFLGSSPQYSEI